MSATWALSYKTLHPNEPGKIVSLEALGVLQLLIQGDNLRRSKGRTGGGEFMITAQHQKVCPSF